MNSIQIDDQVFAELAKRATGFNVTPNDVLRRILDIGSPASQPRMASVVARATALPNSTPVTLLDFIRGDQFQRLGQAVDRYLVILGWLHSAHPANFGDAALGFRRGNRIYFAKSEREVLQGGEGVTAKQIPNSPYWALTTLDNKTKRMILEDVLHALSYSRGDINLVLAAIPDSGIRRNHGHQRLLASL